MKFLGQEPRSDTGRKIAVAALEKGFAVSWLDALGLSGLRDLAISDIGTRSPELAEALAEAFAGATLAEWEKRLEGMDVCVSPVYTPSEAVERRRRAAGPFAKRREKLVS